MTNISASELQLTRWVGPRGQRDTRYKKAQPSEFDDRPCLFVRIRRLHKNIEGWSAGGTQRVGFNSQLSGNSLLITVKVESKLWKGKPAGEVHLISYELVWGFLDMMEQPNAAGLLTAWGVPFHVGTLADTTTLFVESGFAEP